ncbi:hypothetical protein ACJIZ3_010009 [Penstemon smallii]|uniref:K Homology domain-containing protein n=1 Tax=Penstemon smallii TaxID=265156 RepID=A0ABD3TFX8_9LAMI
MPQFPSYMRRRDRSPPFNKFDGPGGLHPGGDFMMITLLLLGPVEGAGPMVFPDYQGAPQRRLGGFAGTTVDVVVPSFVISEAEITITDPKPGATETKTIIHGMPDQTRAAQSLIQAFVLSEIEAH